jgi:hypothetical protein
VGNLAHKAKNSRWKRGTQASSFPHLADVADPARKECFPAFRMLRRINVIVSFLRRGITTLTLGFSGSRKLAGHADLAI